MSDTLHDQDIILLDKISYCFTPIKRLDIAVIEHDSNNLIKRVIGLPGEEIRYQDNILYVKDQKVEENFSHKEMEDFLIESFNVDKIPKNYYLVLGDNRNDSVDSRRIRLIEQSKIKGRAFSLFIHLIDLK